MEAQYQQGFPVPPLFLNPPADVVLNTVLYIDFAGKAVSAIDPEIIQRIAANIQLSFVPEKEKESEVCFINSEEVRPEFKLSFAPVDLSDYILAVLHHSHHARHTSLPETGHLTIPYPKDSLAFWEWVKSGEQLRQIT
jgi:hypothetical protein